MWETRLSRGPRAPTMFGAWSASPTPSNLRAGVISEHSVRLCKDKRAPRVGVWLSRARYLESMHLPLSCERVCVREGCTRGTGRCCAVWLRFKMCVNLDP